LGGCSAAPTQSRLWPQGPILQLAKYLKYFGILTCYLGRLTTCTLKLHCNLQERFTYAKAFSTSYKDSNVRAVRHAIIGFETTPRRTAGGSNQRDYCALAQCMRYARLVVTRNARRYCLERSIVDLMRD
jgi:hypothetical protein